MFNIDELAKKYETALAERNAQRAESARKECSERIKVFTAQLHSVEDLAKALSRHKQLHNKCLLPLAQRYQIEDNGYTCRVSEVNDYRSEVFEFKTIGASIEVFSDGTSAFLKPLFPSDIEDVPHDTDGSVARSISHRCERFGRLIDLLFAFINERLPLEVDEQIKDMQSDALLDKIAVKRG